MSNTHRNLGKIIAVVHRERGIDEDHAQTVPRLVSIAAAREYLMLHTVASTKCQINDA